MSDNTELQYARCSIRLTCRMQKELAKVAKPFYGRKSLLFIKFFSDLYNFTKKHGSFEARKRFLDNWENLYLIHNDDVKITTTSFMMKKEHHELVTKCYGTMRSEILRSFISLLITGYEEKGDDFIQTILSSEVGIEDYFLFLGELKNAANNNDSPSVSSNGPGKSDKDGE